MLDQRLREPKTVGAVEYQPQGADEAITLRCASCGQGVDLAFWQPIVHCPHCQKFVYPDRSLRNLLPLGWDCPECGTSNDGLTNFCLHCGAGLASRCLHCEAPVYGPICLRCGEHQAHLRHLQQREAVRAAWIPIQRERVRTQLERAAEQARFEQQQAAIPVPVPLPAEDRTTRRQREREERHARRRRRGGGWRFGLPWWIIFPLLFWLLPRMAGSARTLSPGGAAITSPTGVTPGFTSVQDWWSAFVPTLSRLPTLTRQDLAYAYLFAAALIGLAALPLMAFVVDRVVKRLFP